MPRRRKKVEHIMPAELVPGDLYYFVSLAIGYSTNNDPIMYVRKQWRQNTPHNIADYVFLSGEQTIVLEDHEVANYVVKCK